MGNATIANLETRLAGAVEALRIADERAIAGRLALELMHEIRNPIESLGYLSYLTREDANDPHKVRQYMDFAEEQIAQLRNLAGQTLGFVRASPSPKQINLADLIEAGLRVHRRAIESKKIHVVKILPQDATALVYPAEILQVISNMIANSLDALSDEGTLRLRLRKYGSDVYFVIADNGHGIADEHTHRIFQPFFTTKGERGTGLGLSLSSKIIEHHHGTISVRSSVFPGKTGTTFRVRLPAYPELRESDKKEDLDLGRRAARFPQQILSSP